MKTELIVRFLRLLFGVCRKVCSLGWKFVLAWIILVGGYWAFDYKLMVWLVMEFGYYMIIPLYPAIFLACWAGVYIYDFFHEDVYFLEKIREWMNKDGRYHLTRKIKSLARKNQTNLFIGISIWYSPLHAYIYVRGNNKNEFGKMIKMLAIGSLACAIFWGMLVDLILLMWHFANIWDILVVILALVIYRQLMKIRIAIFLKLRGGSI